MNIFEGYVGIRLWDGQLVDDVIFSLLLFLFIVFSFVFRTNFQLFVKMLKDAFLVKERQNLFDDVIGKSIFFFRNFMTFQVLFLSSIALIAVGRIYGFVNYVNGRRFYRRSERFFVFYSCFISLNNAVIISWAACFPTPISISYGRRVIMLLWGFGESLYTFRCCGWCLSGHR